MVNKILGDRADMIVGDRLSSTYFEENKRPFHNFGDSIVRLSINTLFKNDIKDIMTGYRAFSYRFGKTFPVLSKGFEIETEMSIHAIDKNMFVENVIIDYRDRPAGSESKLNTYSAAFFIPVFTAFKRTGEAAQFQTLIVCDFVMIAAIISYFAGVVLKTIYQENRQDFEMDLYRGTSELNAKLMNKYNTRENEEIIF